MISCPTLKGVRLVEPTLHPVLLATGGQSDNPFASINDDFSVGPTDPTLRTPPWSWYRLGCVRVGEIVAGRLRIIPVEGGGASAIDEPHSWWYSLNAGFIRSGMLLFKLIGPGASPPTPRDFSARARITVSNEAGTAPPPGGPGIFTFGGLAIHSPVRPPVPGAGFEYDHGAAGTEPATPRAWESKTTQGNESIYPVIPVVGGGPGDPINCDVRIDRIDQLVYIYFRPAGDEPLSSDVGFVLGLFIDHDNAAIPPRSTAEPLPDTLQIGFMAYSNIPGPGIPSLADVMLEADSLVVLPIAA